MVPVSVPLAADGWLIAHQRACESAAIARNAVNALLQEIEFERGVRVGRLTSEGDELSQLIRERSDLKRKPMDGFADVPVIRIVHELRGYRPAQ